VGDESPSAALFFETSKDISRCGELLTLSFCRELFEK